VKLLDVFPRRLFTYEAEDEIEFPDGLTVIVGPNGSGKTALGLESIAWTLWGRTTRGTTPDGEVAVRFETAGQRYEVHRSRKGKRGGMLNLCKIYVGGLHPAVEISGQTATETQAKIDELVGSWERFCAERVFSNRLRARFGSATDKERKALLESCLGLERHERAAKVARTVAGARRNALESVRATLAAARGGLDQATRALAAIPPALGETLDQLRASVAAHAERQTAATARARELEIEACRQEGRQRTIGIARMEAVEYGRGLVQRLKDAEGRLVGLRHAAEVAGKIGDCPVCLTPAANISRERIAAHHQPAVDAAAREVEELRAAVDAARAEVNEMSEDVDNVAKGAARARSEADAAAADVRALIADTRLERALASEERRAEVEATAREAQAACQARLDAAEKAEQVAELSCLEVEAVVTALGQRGARVARFGSALVRLNAEAASLLNRLPVDDVGPLGVKVRGDRQLANGDTVDEVSIEVTGAGGGEYDGTSDGERARIDVALMLGMSRVAGGTGLLVFDEIFDPLDTAALEAIADVLRDLATKRQVVVITHNPRFLDLLPASSCWRVSRAGGGSRIVRA
jgi:DNA repair exonuclease SbcCD ATPase subunit